MGASPPKQVVDLVERFSRDRKVFLSPEYKEEQLRDTAYGRQLTAFRLRPSDSDSGRSAVSRKLMASSARGWDVANKAGLTEVFKPVIHEESIKIAGATKAPAAGSRLATHSLRLSVSDSGRSAEKSRWPLALLIGGRIDICLAVGIFWT